MDSVERMVAPVAGVGDDRTVDLSDGEGVLSEQTWDDTDEGWGEHPTPNDDRLRSERPPHWD